MVFMAKLIIEIGFKDIPVSALNPMKSIFKLAIGNQMNKSGLKPESIDVKVEE